MPGNFKPVFFVILRPARNRIQRSLSKLLVPFQKRECDRDSSRSCSASDENRPSANRSGSGDFVILDRAYSNVFDLDFRNTIQAYAIENDHP